MSGVLSSVDKTEDFERAFEGFDAVRRPRT